MVRRFLIILLTVSHWCVAAAPSTQPAPNSVEQDERFIQRRRPEDEREYIQLLHLVRAAVPLTCDIYYADVASVERRQPTFERVYVTPSGGGRVGDVMWVRIQRESEKIPEKQFRINLNAVIAARLYDHNYPPHEKAHEQYLQDARSTADLRRAIPDGARLYLKGQPLDGKPAFAALRTTDAYLIHGIPFGKFQSLTNKDEWWLINLSYISVIGPVAD